VRFVKAEQSKPTESRASVRPGEVTTICGFRPAGDHSGQLRSGVRAIVLSILLLAAGIALLIFDRAALFAAVSCQANNLTCPAWWEAPAFETSVFAWAVAGVAIDGARRRPYGRWLIRAVALLSMYLLVPCCHYLAAACDLIGGLLLAERGF
jgi:hypothetical protein